VAQEAKLFEIVHLLLMAPRTRMTVLSTLLATLAGIFPLIACWSNTTSPKTTTSKLGFNQINQTF